MEKSKVLIIYTGGTIGMVEDHEDGHLIPFDFDNLQDQVPELKKLDVELSSISFEKPIDSSDMDPAIWGILATMVAENYADHDGFVILHGSDTLAYTASALSFMLENVGKPVILTGAQLPIDVIRSDGKENLLTAIEIAATKENGKAVLAEVAVYFEFQLYRGNRTHKVSSEAFEAFRSPNYPVLAEAGVHIRFHRFRLRTPNGLPLEVQTGMDTNVSILTLFPGISEAAVNAQLETPGLKGIILHTFGSGNAPTAHWFIEALIRAIKAGIIVLNVTQCSTGSVEQGRYETSSRLKKIGVLGGADITMEAAITKLMFLLDQCDSAEEFKELWLKSLRGEISEGKMDYL